MKIVSVLLTLVIVCLAGTVCGETRWPEIAHAVTAYTQHPSTESARSAIAVIPEKPVTFSGSDPETEANRSIYSDKTMTVLEKQVQKRHPASVELAFRLMNVADGAFAEDLETLLSKLITIDPALFLEELQKANLPHLEGVLLNLDLSNGDEMEKTCGEWERRKKSLETVNTPNLQDIKKRAIATLMQGMGICKQ